jgi:uncharacterized protein (TIGR02147 family)
MVIDEASIVGYIYLQERGRRAMIDIFDYFDYRKLLKDLYNERKAANPFFSYRLIGSKVGFSSAGFFTKILQGRTNISLKIALEFAKLFKLKKHELHYFDLLVQFNQAKTHDEKKYFFEKLISMKQAKGKNLVPEQYELFSRWYYVVIREIVGLYPFYGNYKELAAMVVPAIKETEAKKAVLTLEKLGLVVKNPDGYYEQTDAVISTGDEWKSLGIQNFQIEAADLAKHAIRNIPKRERDISTLTLSISPKTLESIRERLKQFRRELLELARTDAFADRVHQVNIHVFPVSRSKHGDTQ